MNEVTIIIVVYNISSFLGVQARLIHKYCTDENFRICVVDSSTNPEASFQIKIWASICKCEYIKVDTSYPDSSLSHAQACKVGYEHFFPGTAVFLFLDHDNFPVKPFSVLDFMKEKVIAGILQERTSRTSGNNIQYLWPGLLMLNITRMNPYQGTLIDFSVNEIIGLDTGGNLYKLLQTVPENEKSFLTETKHKNEASPNEYTEYAMLWDETFMHFINASNWAKSENDTQRIFSLKEILNVKTQEYFGKNYRAVIMPGFCECISEKQSDLQRGWCSVCDKPKQSMKV